MDPLFIGYVFIVILFEITAQYLFKKSYMNKDKGSSASVVVTLGVLLYMLTGYFTYKLLKYGSLGIVNVVWHLVHFIALFAVGYYLLGEKMSHKQIVASILGVISLGLFMSEGGHH